MSEQNWNETPLPEELKAKPMFKDIPNLGTLVKVTEDLQSYRGRSIAVPPPDAPPEEQTAFRAKLTEKVPDLAKALEAQMQAQTKEQERAAALKASQETLRKDLGAAYDERIAAAATAAESLGFPGATVAAIRAGQMPAQDVKAFIAMAKKVTGPGNEVATQGNGGSQKMTPAEIDIEIRKHMDTPGYYEGRRPDLHRRVAELYAQRGS